MPNAEACIIRHSTKMTLRKNPQCHHNTYPNEKLHAGKVLAGTSIDLDLIAGVDEQRNEYRSAGLNSCRLGSVGSSVALNTRLSLGDLKFSEHRRLNCEDIAVVRIKLNDLIFLNELKSIAYFFSGKSDLIISLGVHEVVSITIRIEILEIRTIDMSQRELLGRAEGSLADTTVNDILKLGTYECSSLTGLYVLEFDNLTNLTIILDRKTIFEITG